MTDRSTAVARTARLLKESGCDESGADTLARRIADIWQPRPTGHSTGLPMPPVGGVTMPEGFREQVRTVAMHGEDGAATPANDRDGE